MIREVLKSLAEGRAVTKVDVLAAEGSDPNPKVPVPQDLDRDPDQNPEVVPGVLHGRVPDQLRDHVPVRVPNLDLNLDPCRGPSPVQCRDLSPVQRRDLDPGPGLDRARNREVNRDREARRDQDQARPRVDLVRDQLPGPDRVRGRVNLDRGRVVVRGKARPNRDRDQDPQLAGLDRDPDLRLLLGKLDHGQGQDRGPEAVRSRTNGNPEAKADRNPNPFRDPDRVRGRRAVHEAVAPVVQHGLPLRNPGNLFRAATLVRAIRARTEVEETRANKSNVRIEIISIIRGRFTLIVHYTLLYG